MALNCAILSLRRHGVFRVQRMCACSAGSAAFGSVSEVEFHGAAGSSRGHAPAKGRERKVKENRVRAKAKVAPAPSAPAAGSRIDSPPPLSSVESPVPRRPPVKEEKSLDAIDRLGIVKPESRKHGRHPVTFANDIVVGDGTNPVLAHSSSGYRDVLPTSWPGAWYRSFGPNAIFVLTSHWCDWEGF